MKDLSKKAQKELLRKDGKCKAMYADTIRQFVKGNVIHPVTYTGRGRNISTRDMSQYIENALNLMGYKFTTGNNAPNGGKSGYFIKVSTVAKNALIELSLK